jgi:hypothetical protein
MYDHKVAAKEIEPNEHKRWHPTKKADEKQAAAAPEPGSPQP